MTRSLWGGAGEAMYLIQRKIFRRTLIQTLMVFAFVGVIVTTTQVLNQVFRLIDASSNLSVAVRLYLYLMPTVTVSVLPLAFLIATINIFDQMDEDRETVIVHGTGAHPIFLLVPAGLLALLMSGFVLVFSIYVEPGANRVTRETINGLKFDALKLIAGDGALREVQPGLYIRGGGYGEDGLIDGLFILDRRNPAEEVTYTSRKGEFVEDAEGVHLRLIDGAIQARDRQDASIHKIRFGNYIADPGSIFEDRSSPGYRPRHTATARLRDLLTAQDFSAFTESAIRKELIRRYTDWLYPLVFFSVCAFFVLQSRFSRQLVRWRLATAVMTGFVLKAAGLVLLGNAGGGGLAAAATFVLPAGACFLLLSAGLLRATRGGRRYRRIRAADALGAQAGAA